jgi:N,N'-diacetyllegionaminate synthase
LIINYNDTNDKVIIVAEIGNNHEGNFELAMEMINSAYESGADAVKFQTFIPEHYVSAVTDPERVEKLGSFQLSFSEFEILKAESDRLGICFFSTPFDLKSAKFLNNIQSLFKISSGDNDFQALLKLTASFGKNLIISTGLCKDADVEAIYKLVMNIWKNTGSSAELALLHCVSSYPVPDDEANLLAITTLKEKFPDVVIGYSDHVKGIEACLGAVALGARIIEKHFTLDKNYSTFRDHQLSSDPEEFKSLTLSIRRLETMLGEGSKIIQPCEEDIIKVARRSIASSKELAAGHIITTSDITWVRPGAGFSCKQESEILGKKLLRSVTKSQIFTKEDVFDS